MVVDNDGCHYAATASGDVQLSATAHRVQLEYFHKNGKVLEGWRAGATLLLEVKEKKWSTQRHQKEIEEEEKKKKT